MLDCVDSDWRVSTGEIVVVDSTWKIVAKAKTLASRRKYY